MERLYGIYVQTDKWPRRALAGSVATNSTI
jgi:hypothetical protein